MFASSCRRRLLLHIPGEGTNHLRSIQSRFKWSGDSSTAAISRAPSSKLCPATVSYLVSCGLSPTAAAATATSQKIRILSTSKADAVLALLRAHGFTDADIVRTVRSAPTVLVVDPERILRPKLDFFASLGFEPHKLATAPFLLVRSLDKHIVPSVQFIRDAIGSEDALLRSLSRVPRALMADVDRNMRPSVDALRRCGFTDAAISKLLVIQISVLMTSPDRIREIFEELKAIGMCMSDSRFLYCFRAMCSVKRDTWRRKLALFQSFGLSEAEVLRAFKTQPMLFLFADETIKKKVGFFLDELKLGISDIIAQPVILSYSLEKCILPRCAVLSVLMKEGKIRRDVKLVRALLGNSTDFKNRYVVRHADDVPDVVKAYEDADVNQLTSLCTSIGRSARLVVPWTKLQLVIHMQTSSRMAVLFSAVTFAPSGCTESNYMKNIFCGISNIIAQPVILSYSLEKCILPRCAVLSVLMKEGKIQRDVKLVRALLGNLTDFSTRYVLGHMRVRSNLKDSQMTHDLSKKKVI